MAGYHSAKAEEITHFGSHVAEYLGEGVNGFFGYPESQDDDAERAIRAGLAILETIRKLNRTSGETKLSVRVGIDSGMW